MAESSKGRYKLELGEEVQVRLRDLLLRCPCAALDGIRWSVVCKVYADRYQGGPLIGASALDAAKTCLADLATFDEAASGDARLRLREEAALSAGKDGQLGCWPLLLQRLGEIVRNHGSAQPLQGTEAEHIGTSTGEVLGVLLGQLKHLLSRYWDPAFEDRGLSFFNEVGQFVHLRKMKHFLAELLKWRARRRELVLNKALPPSAIDEALGDQLMLVASQRHNDMVLCCPASPTVMPATPAAARPQASCASTPPKAQRGREGGSPLQSGIGISEESPGSDEVPDPKRQELLEKESRRLRIENAELKKRLQFGSEFLKQENRRLRVENAELKKRLYFAGPYAQGTSSVPIWVPVPVMAASPNCGSPNSGAARATMSAGCGSGQVSPGTGTPATPAQGSGTPIQHGFWVPLARNAVMSPTGPSWPLVAAVQIGTTGSTRSTFSDASQQERFLPQNVISDPTSSAASNAGQASASADGTGYTVPFQGSDDRWVCIPSGIVERHKAQFEAPSTGEALEAQEGASSCQAGAHESPSD
ncbi:unnamed protein product [Symbiodinium sp. CCMP2456]|nr:unnamed protein product [Symbiodinium sp. CCMP2456]